MTSDDQGSGEARLVAFLQRLSWRWLVPLAVLTALAPWPAEPEPHLLQKVRWLFEGALYKPLDIFDLLFHAAPSVLLVAKAVVAGAGFGDRGRD